MYFKSGGDEIYYQVTGKDNDQAIVFLHGVGMDHRTFIEQAEALKHRYRVIILDLPGHGRSSGIDKYQDFSAKSAGLIIELLDYLEIDRVIMVGQSLGSFIVQKAAAKHPERILASVHLSGGSLYPGYSSIIKLFKPFTLLTISLMPEKFLYKMFARHKAYKSETQNYLQDVTSANGKKIITRLTLEMFDDMSSGIPEPLDHNILIVYGEHELNVLKKLSLKWHEKHDRSKLAEIKDAHHIANQDNPEEFNEVIESFCWECLDQKEKAQKDKLQEAKIMSAPEEII